MSSCKTAVLLNISVPKRIHNNSFLVIYPDELKDLDKHYNTTSDSLYLNLKLSVSLTDMLLQFVKSIDFEQTQRKAIALQKKYPNATAGQISKKLEDCRKWIRTKVSKRLEKYYPPEVVKCAMIVYLYEGNSKFTYNFHYRKLQEAIFSHQGTVKERLDILTKAYKRSQIEAKIQQPISDKKLEQLLNSYTDCMNILAKYKLTEDQLNKLSMAEIEEYLNRKNELIDTVIENRLKQIAKVGKKNANSVSKKDKLFFDCFIGEFNDKTIQNNQVSGQIRPTVTYKELKKVVDHDRDYSLVNADVNYRHDIREKNLRDLARRPPLPVRFDRNGRAYLKRTDI